MTAMRRRDLTLVILTRNRRTEVLRTLWHSHRVLDAVPILVVDNGSSDGTPEAIRRAFPSVEVVALGANRGAAGRNVGARAARTRYVAFSDDDTWWARGSLDRAIAVLDATPGLAAITGHVLVGREQRDDPASLRMAASPLPNDLRVPGALVLGVMAGACVVRRDAFIGVGGYHPRFLIGAEEALLATDLAAAGWRMAYLPDAVVHHHPSSTREAHRRRRMALRNRLWHAWLRRPAGSALRRTATLSLDALRDWRLTPALFQALAGTPWVLRERRVVSRDLEAKLRTIEAAYRNE